MEGIEKLKKKTMTVQINGISLQVPQGATNGDAVRAYYAYLEMEQPKILPEIFDRYGNAVAPDGAIAQNGQLHVFLLDR